MRPAAAQAALMSGRKPGDRRVAEGARGESLARQWLEGRSFVVLAARWRCRMGELDLIAREGGTIVFVEVRSRRSDRSGRPEESVGPQKRRRIARLAALWLAGQPRPVRDAPCRFDVIAVTGERIEHIRGAFEGSGAA